MKWQDMRKLRKANDNYWQQHAIRNIDDFNLYAEHLKEKRNFKIKIGLFIGLIIILIIAYLILSKHTTAMPSI